MRLLIPVTLAFLFSGFHSTSERRHATGHSSWTTAPTVATSADSLRFSLDFSLLPDTLPGATGTAWIDADGDSFVDVAIAGRDSVESRVWRGSKDGFERVSIDVDPSRFTNVVAWADLNRDGFSDLLLGQDGLARFTASRGAGGLILRTLGDSSFLAGENLVRGAIEGLATGDLDGDGLPDVVAVGHGRGGAYVLRNTGSKFELMARDAFPFSGYYGSTQVIDLDSDGRNDILVTGAPLPGFRTGSIVYWNEGGNWNADRSNVFASQPGALGASVADVDNDGDLDVFVAGWTATTHGVLYLNEGSRRFRKVAGSFPNRIVGSAFADINADNNLDLLLSTGYTDEGRIEVLLNEGNGRFSRTDVPGLTDVPGFYSGLSVVDIDRDGRLDVAVASSSHRVRIFRNSSASSDWMHIALQPAPNSQGIWGSQVTVVIRDGSSTRTLRQSISQQTGYGGHGEPVASFALSPSSTVSSVVVRWPNGSTTRLHDVRRNERTTISPPGT